MAKAARMAQDIELNGRAIIAAISLGDTIVSHLTDYSRRQPRTVRVRNVYTMNTRIEPRNALPEFADLHLYTFIEPQATAMIIRALRSPDYRLLRNHRLEYLRVSILSRLKPSCWARRRSVRTPRALRSRSPETLLSERVNRDVKCFSLGQRLISVPISEIKRNAVYEPIASICVRPAPVIR